MAGVVGGTVNQRRLASTQERHTHQIGARGRDNPAVVENVALARTHELERANVARPTDVVDLVVTIIEHACGFHPPLDAAAAMGPRRPDVLACRQRDRAPGAEYLLRQLNSRRRGPDHKDAKRSGGRFRTRRRAQDRGSIAYARRSQASSPRRARVRRCPRLASSARQSPRARRSSRQDPGPRSAKARREAQVTATPPWSP